jgi:hypothetical protein
MKIRNLLLLSFLVFFAGCASSTPDRKLTPGTPSKASIEAKQVAAQEHSSHVVELRFGKGATALKPEESKKITTLVEDSRKKGPVRHATLLAWADEEMPSQEGQDLSEAAIGLADRRGKTLEAFFRAHYPKVKTDFVNMAERSGKVAEFLKTEEARIQDSLAEGTATPKASHAIVILKMKGDGEG